MGEAVRAIHREMTFHKLIFTVALIAVVGAADDDFLYGKFPAGFLWGTATSAYQIEGAWNVSGKGENNWDRFTHVGGNVANNDTGDDACKSYDFYKDDVRLLKDMGVNHYRFSISWARIFPDGTNSSYNQQGMDYYHRLVDELRANDIIPMVTLFHWDLPQALEDQGGWLNDSIVGHFRDYADMCYRQLGPKIKWWITFNEPLITCWLGMGVGVFAPGVKDAPGTKPYVCAHHLLLAHAEAYHLYKDVYKTAQNGKCSITLNSDWKEAKTDLAVDKAAAERAQQFMLGWYAHPIYSKDGDYPKIMRDKVLEKSTAQGLNVSRLPQFTTAQISRVQGTFDYFGLNSYTTQLIEHNDNSPSDISYGADQDVRESNDPSWPRAKSVWLYEVPWGLRKLLNWIKNEYENPDVIITENGVSDDGELNDYKRIRFYNGYINNVLKAIGDGVSVKGYTAWSLLDNFEWASGYDEKFGLHQVNFSDPSRTRTPKASVDWFKTLIQYNGFEAPPPDNACGISASLALIVISVIVSMM